MRIGIWQDTLEFTCTWDLGRRCSLDCSYCPEFRHNSWSPHARLHDLVETAEIPLEFIRFFRKSVFGDFSFLVSFTGGEPTLNPEFLQICAYLKEKDSLLKVGLTTNGLFSEEYMLKLVNAVDFITLSYHFEAGEAARKRIEQNIFKLHDFSKDPEIQLKTFSVNLMVHAEDTYFENCLELADTWNKKGIAFSRRYIGEKTEDSTAHKYKPEQLQFLKSGTTAPDTMESPRQHGGHSGRPCCGGRPFREILHFDPEKGAQSIECNTRTERVVDRNFKGWKCLVPYFFLHIEQESGNIFTHQTCQVNFDNEVGPIGQIENKEKIIHRLKSMFESGKIQAVTCPNKVCGCGLCITKAPEAALLKTFTDRNFPGFEVV